jgi:uncharacterized membrane protein
MSEEQTVPEKKGRWRTVLLIGSLCLNFLLVGAVGMGVARFVFWPAPDGARPSHAGMYFGIGRGAFNPDMMGRMTPAKSDEIRRIVDAHRGELQNLRRASIVARGDAMRIFAARDFDPVAFDAALARIETADAAFEAGTMKVVSASAARLSAEERKQIVDRWRMVRGHGRGDGSGGGPGGGPGGGMGRYRPAD